MSSLLLDADVIINLHAHGVWEAFLNKNIIYIGSIVVSEAARYKNYQTNQYHLIQYDSRANILSGDVNEIQRIRNCFCPVNGPEIHAGELEEIVILREHHRSGLRFCTCDRGAIQAMAMLGLESNGISFEEALTQSSIQIPLLKKSWTKAAYARLVQMGSNNRVLGLKEMP